MAELQKFEVINNYMYVNEEQIPESVPFDISNGKVNIFLEKCKHLHSCLPNINWALILCKTMF